MARVKITEYRAKKLLQGESYKGIEIHAGVPAHVPNSGRFVVKVDEGVKKRFKQGLVAVDVSPAAARRRIAEWKKKGYSRFLVEPYIPHKKEDERYISFERVREGIRILYSASGGVNVEGTQQTVVNAVIVSDKDIATYAKRFNIPESFLKNAVRVFDAHFFAFLEINPFLIKNKTVHLLDAAVLVDGTGIYFQEDGWREADIVESKTHHQAEKAVLELSQTTPASLKLTVLNQNAPLFLLLSGGGGSIVIADEAEVEGMGTLLGNYGEYSGGPTRAETHLYARQIVRLLLNSRSKRKALVIAGGVANFTDIQSTFSGIIDALSEHAPELRKAGVKVFVRRGGPNERAGLKAMKEFLEAERLFGSVHGSESIITLAMTEALAYVRS